MKIDATPETIRAVADVLKYAAFLDDRIGHADQGRIAAWAEQVQRHELRRDDLMAGVCGFYDSGRSYPCGVGDLIEHASIARRDRNSRAGHPTPPLAWDEEAVAEVKSVAMSFEPGPVKNPTNRLEAAENGLHTCFGRMESMAAIREYFAAKREAKKAQQ
jgi:hypothetical protein